MSQLSDFIHKIQLDLQGGITYATAVQIWADIKAEKPVIEADLAAFGSYVTTNAAVEEGILTELISLSPAVGIPAAGVLALQAALTAVQAVVAAENVGSDATQALIAGFATLNQAWATRLAQVLAALGVQ